MNRWLPALLGVFLWSAGLSTALALDDGWPRTLAVGEGLVTIYPPQIDGLKGDLLSYRAALAWRPTAEAEPVFGAGWFESRVAIDQGRRVVRTLDLKVTRTRFPDGTVDIQPRLAAAVADQAPGWNLDLSLDDLDASLRTARAEEESLQSLSTTPPRIVYRDHPAVLLNLDGEPVLRDIENSPYQAVVNTPYPLISDGRYFYLNAARDVWYRADRATGPYRYEADPPAKIAAMVEPDAETGMLETAAEPVTAANAPEIIVATEPTELIVTDGPAVFVPLVDDLLVLQNSDDDVFMHVGTQQYYIVLAGRWYHASTLKGPWTHRAADELPPAFAEIPTDSAQADSRVYVAGTPEAKAAVLDAQIPQTRAVARGASDVEVRYDGEPEFAPVDGTDLEYAANTGSTVLQSNRRYYLVEDGVWYESATPNGPWEVATRRPDGVASIAPTSPVYNTKYVYIYGATPTVVYTGYTPGYLGSYVYYDTIVYGTGWYYRPYVSPYYYYPRPSTWGFHAAYTSWDGWSFGLSWNWGWGWGPFYASFYSGGYWHHNHYWHHPHRGYWRPRGHRPRPDPYAHHGYASDRRTHGGHGGDRRDHSGYGDRRGHSSYGDQRGPGDYRDRRPANDGAYPGRGDGRPRGERGRAASAGDAVVADRSKTPLHQPGPLRQSDLRLKARVRDVNAAAARNMLVADRRGDVHAAGERPRNRSAAGAPGGVASKAAGHRTEPAWADGPRTRSGQQRSDRDSRAPQDRYGAGQPARMRRPQPAASPPAFDGGDRTASRNLADRGPAASAGSPARRAPPAGQAPDRPEPFAGPSAQSPPAASRGAPPQREGPRLTRARPQPSAAPTPSRDRMAAPQKPGNRPAAPPPARARTAAPPDPGSRSAPPPRRVSSHQSVGPNGQAKHGGGRQDRRERSNQQ